MVPTIGQMARQNLLLYLTNGHYHVDKRQSRR